jgi:hypothetical protein
MASWKQIVLKAFGVGVGIGVGIAVSVGLYAWYASRPVPQKPWDTNAITASFLLVDSIGDDNHLRFVYILENHTNQDYRVNTALLLLSIVVRTQDSLLGGKHVNFADEEMFLPAKQHAEVKIELTAYHYTGDKPKSDNADDRRKYHEAVKKYVNDTITQLNGFAAFDDVNRYRINFPNGWSPTP